MLRFIPVLGLVLLLVGCGGGGGGGSTGTPAITTTPVTLTFSDGRTEAVGFYAAGTTTKTGHWTMYFDDPSGQKQWEGDYINDVVVGTQPWREWNLDGSIRFDWLD